MRLAGVSGTVIILDQRSYIKIETLRGKYTTEIHGALCEVCGGYIYFRKEDSISEYNRHISTLYGQKLKAVGYQTIVHNSVLPTLWQHLGVDPFLFQHNAPVLKRHRYGTA